MIDPSLIDAPHKGVERTQEESCNRGKAGEHREERGVAHVAPQRADKTRREAATEDRQEPRRNGCRAHSGRRQPGEQAQPGGQNDQLAESDPHEEGE